MQLENLAPALRPTIQRSQPPSDALTGTSPLTRVLQAASALPSPPALLIDLLNHRLGVPAGVLAALELDTNLRGALLAAVRLRYGALPDLSLAWARLGTTTMVGHLVETALVLHQDCLPGARFEAAFQVAGALCELGRANGLDPQLTFAAGALHGVGEVALTQAIRLISPVVSGKLALGEVALDVVERALKLSRFQVGASLLAMHGLPAVVWQAIGRQADAEGPKEGLPQLLQTARRAAEPGGLKGYAGVAADDAAHRALRLRRVLCGR